MFSNLVTSCNKSTLPSWCWKQEGYESRSGHSLYRILAHPEAVSSMHARFLLDQSELEGAAREHLPAVSPQDQAGLI